jgi:hypothetical protein
MFVPNHFVVGQEVVSTAQLAIEDGHFTVGHYFKVTHIEKMAGGVEWQYDLVDNDGRKVFNVRQNQLKEYLCNYMDR